jgi:hypothetical protein
MIPSGREWHPASAASATALADLRSVAPARLPATYLELLAFSNGGEGPLPVAPFNLCLYSAEDVIEIERECSYREFFPGLFVIGGSGGGEAIALDVRGAEPWPVVYFDTTNIDLQESVQPLAPDFDSFITMIGLAGASSGSFTG